MYFNAINGKTSCVDYITCKKLGMSPQIVYESGKNIAVCVEGAI